RLLTRFSVPEELFGPLSIRALEEDRYERHTDGFLPDATIAFIDEVFKANSAILNALLTLLNEREFDNGAGRQLCPLVSVIGATNEVPDDEVGEA
ncbi:AAA family ATPase, partial [Streptococcus suis]